jgi:aspartate/methionine/tyrosine aminotransferase
MPLFASRIADLGTENAFTVAAHIRRAEEAGMDVIRFNLGEPDFDSAEHINRAAIRQIEAGNTHYADPQGILPLRQAVARHVTETRGVEVGPERVVVTPGAKPPIGHTMAAYVDPGDEVVYPSPGFPIYESLAIYSGAVPRPLHLSEDRSFAFSAADLDGLLTDRTKLIILNSPSNPTGAVLGKDDLDEIADVIRTRCHPDVRIFSDEVYEHIVFDGERHDSIIGRPGMAERTVLVSGHSKGFAMTGWRLGWAILPTAEEAEIFTRININSFSCVPPFIQEGGRAAYEDPASTAVVAGMVAAFEERRNWVVPALNAIDGIHCALPRGAFYVFPNISGVCQRLGAIEAWETLPSTERERTSPAGLVQLFLLYRYGVATIDRNSFGSLGAAGQHFLRLSVATSLDRIQEGVRRIGPAVSDPDGFHAFVENRP